MQIQRVATSSLSFWPENARKHGPVNHEAIKQSLTAFGQAEPLVVQMTTNRVIGGNGRLAAMRELGWTECDVVFLDLDDVKAAALGVALNRTGELAEWNDETLAKILTEIDARGELATVGFDQDDLTELLARVSNDALGADLDEVPEPPETATTRKGDLWILGNHRLLCGDSTSQGAIERLTGGELVDLVVTSPPYNCGKEYGTHDDSMIEADYLAFVESALRSSGSTLKSGRFLAWNVGVSPVSLAFEHAHVARALGLRFVRELVWKKVGVAFPVFNVTEREPVARNYHPNYQHELVYLFCNGEPEKGAACEVGEDCSTDVWEFHQSVASRDVPGDTNGRKPKTAEHGGAKAAVHPAAFPVELPARVMRHLSARGEIVFEPFCGAGSTIIAGESLGRSVLAIELEPRFVDVAVRRWEKATGKHATLEGNGKTFDEVKANRVSGMAAAPTAR